MNSNNIIAKLREYIETCMINLNKSLMYDMNWQPLPYIEAKSNIQVYESLLRYMDTLMEMGEESEVTSNNG